MKKGHVNINKRAFYDTVKAAGEVLYIAADKMANGDQQISAVIANEMAKELLDCVEKVSKEQGVILTAMEEQKC